MKKANHCPSCVQGTPNNKKSDVAKFATGSEPIKGVFFKMTSKAQHDNEAEI